MQFIRDIHAAKKAQGKPVISFEFFPPKTDEGDKNLLEKTIPELMKLRPDFCSVTYGAGGGTRDKTIGIVDRIQRDHGLTAMMHLTCVNATKGELTSVINEARQRGIKNILALRGDKAGGNYNALAVPAAHAAGFTGRHRRVTPFRFLKGGGGGHRRHHFATAVWAGRRKR